MNSALNKEQTEYVFYHLKHHVSGLDKLQPFFRFREAGKNDSVPGTIVFPLSGKDIDIAASPVIDGIPVLFPASKKNSFYHLTQDGSLVFHHDLLKSAFYLLSGYQEQKSDHADFMERFPYEESVQKKLEIVTKPVVNYYFGVIIDGLELFAEKHGIAIKRKRLFDTFGFLLSHDIDRVDYFHWRETAYRWMQVAGLKKAHYPKNRLLKAAVNSVLPTVFRGIKEDPFQNFEKLRTIEKKYGILSTWFFLNRDGSPHDARYLFSEKRIKDVLNFLNGEKCEVGLHGSIKTANSAQAMNKALTALKEAYPGEITGTRQHFLKFFYPLTFKIQHEAGFKYDTTLCFAGHEGFRNSYCYPFKPYDVKNDRMIDIWEFPLNVMDGTLFYYRKLDFDNAQKAVAVITGEVKKFGGIFSLLWHNSMFDEYELPGITNFYAGLLKNISMEATKSMTGQQLLQQIENY